ncbi:MAG TPA: GntR family transcriptional regulator [Trueperaceae bacterium]|nr:GntR family transcriptional regulator [Trueperaceae bacterium]
MLDDGLPVGSKRQGVTGKGERLKQVIVDKIRSGEYPIGHRLVSVRKAAPQFQVHPNTLSRVYRELADDGILRTAHGSGTYVVAVPGAEYAESGVATLAVALADLAEQARQLGLTRTSWEEMIARSTDAAFSGPAPVIWMVECSRKDVQELSHNLSRLLERHVSPLLVDEVPAVLDTAAPDDVFLTTPFHYDELADVVEEDRMLLSVNVVPTPETMVSFAGLKPGVTVSVIASNQPTLGRMVNMVRTFARTVPVAAVLVSSESAELVARDAEVLVDSQSIHDRVTAWRPRGRVITIKYQIEPTSVAYVRAVLHAREESAGA